MWFILSAGPALDGLGQRAFFAKFHFGPIGRSPIADELQGASLSKRCAAHPEHHPCPQRDL